MRDYKNIDRYLNELSQDIYSQPEDDGHTEMIQDVFNKWIYKLGFGNVLDVGCGSEAVAKQFFDKVSVQYTGISLGEANQIQMDMSFLEFEDNSFDMIWSRHVLEHSVMPLITLMEWHRVSSQYLCLIVPNPRHYGFIGRNHYFVSSQQQLIWWLRRAGWRPLEVELTNHEYRFLCLKHPRVGHEGYAQVPLPNPIYEFERDLTITSKPVVFEDAIRRDEEDGDV